MGCGLDLMSPQLIRILLPGGICQCSTRAAVTSIDVSTLIFAKSSLARMDASTLATMLSTDTRPPNHDPHKFATLTG